MLWEWGLNGAAETAELLVSELVTNAVQATAGRDRLLPIRLYLSSDKERLLIEVWDANPRPPVLTRLGEDGIPALGDEGGRGLFLVATLSHRWNWYASRQWGGKVVWCEIQLSANHGSHDHRISQPTEGALPAMTRTAPPYDAALQRAASHQPDRELPADVVSMPAIALPSRTFPAGVRAKRWAPADPETLRRIKAALHRL